MASKTYVVSGETAIIPVGRKDDSGANAVQFITVLKGFTFDGEAIADAGGISASDRLAHLVDVGLVTEVKALEVAPTQSQTPAQTPNPRSDPAKQRAEAEAKAKAEAEARAKAEAEEAEAKAKAANAAK